MAAPTHDIRLTFDEATGEATARQRCTVVVAGHEVSHYRDLELGADAKAALESVIAINRAAIEAEATALAISHAAALAGKKQPGVTPLKVGGRLGAIGGADAQKAD